MAYPKATPSGSFSWNHVSAASSFRKDLEVVRVANVLAGIDVNLDSVGNERMLSVL